MFFTTLKIWGSLLIPVILAITILIIAFQGAIRYWQSPNPYRRTNSLTTLSFLLAMLLPISVGTLGPIDSTLATPRIHFIVLGPSTIFLMLAFFFVNMFYDDIMEGVGSPRARRAHRILSTYLLASMTLSSIFWWRAFHHQEYLGLNWMLLHPWQEPDTLICIWVTMLFEVVCFVRGIAFNLRFIRITPLTWFKASNLFMIVFFGWNLANTLFAGWAATIPSQSPMAPWILRIFIFLIVLTTSSSSIAVTLSWNPSRRTQKVGEQIWSLVTIWRIYPLWRMLSKVIPEVAAPIQMPWFAVLSPPQWTVLRDARIIEILDAVHRLKATIGNGEDHQAWLPPLQEIIEQPQQYLIAPSSQLRSIDRAALLDARNLLRAIATYTPRVRSGGGEQDSGISRLITSHPPAISQHEIHYLELVATYFHRLRHNAHLNAMNAISTIDQMVS